MNASGAIVYHTTVAANFASYQGDLQSQFKHPFEFSANSSNAIYADNATIRPQNISILVLIKI